MPRINILVSAVVVIAATNVHAARIYNLVNYPVLQNGHTLNGTITTTDDAPDDEVLQASELLDWEWSITGSNTFTASALPFNQRDNTPWPRPPRISADAIELPLDIAGVLSLVAGTPPDIYPIKELTWFTGINTITNELTSFTRAGVAFSDTAKGWH